MKSIEPIKIVYDKSLREVLFNDFKSIGKELPIKGGWGYTKEEAILIDKADPIVSEWQPFNFVAIEYLIAEKRIFEEMIIFRAKGDKFRNIKIDLDKQSLLTSVEGNSYDMLIFNVSAFHDKDFDLIEQELFEEMKTKEMNFDVFFESKNHLRYNYKSEFWFDITSSFKPIS